MFRSCLFVPADRPDRFAKAEASGADLVILDLEDAVMPEAKTAARGHVRRFLMERGGSGAIGIRVNAKETAWHEDDLTLAEQAGLDVLMLPKAESGESVAAVSARLQGETRLIPLIETAIGLWNALEIAQAPRVAQLAFGSVDFQLDAGIGDDDPDRAMLYARSRLVLASAAAGIAAPMDGVTVDLDDPAAIAGDVAQARALGFGGKLCIHPRQIAGVHDGFAPTRAALEHARAVVEAADAAGGAGAIRLAGRLVDRPVIERARRILRQQAS